MTEIAGTTGDRIRLVRGGLSQIEFAHRLDADKNTIGRYERNERTPDGDFLKRIRMEFGVNVDWLLTGSGPMHFADIVFTVGGKTILAESKMTTSLDEELLQAAIQGVEEHLTQRRLSMPPDKKAALVATLYSMAADEEVKSLENKTQLIAKLVRLAS